MSLRAVWEAAWRGVRGKPVSKARTFHNLECARLRGGTCDCKMATTVVVPEHFTPIDGLRYSYPREGGLLVIEDAGFYKALSPVGPTGDLVAEIPVEKWRPPYMGEDE